jgi:transposase
MPKQQKTSTKEFKLEAVRLVQGSGKPMSQVARELGVSDSALYHWCKQLAEQGEQAFPGSGHQSAEQEEIRRLKHELEVTRQERDILKKRGWPQGPRMRMKMASTGSVGKRREATKHRSAVSLVKKLAEGRPGRMIVATYA